MLGAFLGPPHGKPLLVPRSTSRVHTKGVVRQHATRLLRRVLRRVGETALEKGSKKVSYSGFRGKKGSEKGS